MDSSLLLVVIKNVKREYSLLKASLISSRRMTRGCCLQGNRHSSLLRIDSLVLGAKPSSVRHVRSLPIIRGSLVMSSKSKQNRRAVDTV